MPNQSELILDRRSLGSPGDSQRTRQSGGTTSGGESPGLFQKPSSVSAGSGCDQGSHLRTCPGFSLSPVTTHFPLLPFRPCVPWSDRALLEAVNPAATQPQPLLPYPRGLACPWPQQISSRLRASRNAAQPRLATRVCHPTPTPHCSLSPLAYTCGSESARPSLCWECPSTWTPGQPFPCCGVNEIFLSP